MVKREPPSGAHDLNFGEKHAEHFEPYATKLMGETHFVRVSRGWDPGSLDPLLCMVQRRVHSCLQFLHIQKQGHVLLGMFFHLLILCMSVRADVQ